MDNKVKAIIVILIGAIIGGAVSPVTKIGLVKIPPFSFSFIRFFLASICLLPFFLKAKIRFDKDFAHLIFLSLLPTVNVALFVLGLKTTTASIGQMLYAGAPIITGVISFTFFKNKLSYKKWIYILMGLVGVFLAILLPLIEKNSLYAGDLRGNILISLGVFLFTIYLVCSKQYQKKYSPLVISSVFIFLSTVVFFFLSFLEFSSNNTWWINLSPSSIFAVFYVSVPGTVLAYILVQYAVKFGGSLLASLSYYLLPVFTYIFAFILLGEKLTTGLIVGTLLVFASIALTTYSK